MSAADFAAILAAECARAEAEINHAWGWDK